MTETQARICVVGSLNMDLVVRAPRLPAAGETILGGPYETYPGGKGANQAVAAARLRGAVTMVGRVGDDEHGKKLRSALAAAGVDVQHVLFTPGTPTGVGLITVAPGGENTIVVVSGANAKLTPADVDAHKYAITNADVLVLQLEVPVEANRRAAEVARNAGVTVVLNAAPAGELPVDLLGAADVLVVNEVEAAAVTRAGAAEDGALVERLAQLPVETVILTVGERGSWYCRKRGRSTHAAPFEVRALDAVGAGDAFVGALATRWGEQQAGGGIDDMGLMDCCCWANAAGALAATKHGAIPSLATRSDVVALLRRREPG